MVHWGSVCCDPPVPKSSRDELWRRTLIEGSLVVCMSRLTQDNMGEWLFRIRFAQRLLDANLFKIGVTRKRGGRRPKLEEIDIDAKILRRWVGLWTNASNMTREEWVNAVIHRVVQRVEGGVDSEMKSVVRKAQGGSK